MIMSTTVRPKPLACEAVRFCGDPAVLEELTDDVYVEEFETNTGRMAERVYVDGMGIEPGDWFLVEPDGRGRVVSHLNFEFAYEVLS